MGEYIKKYLSGRLLPWQYNHHRCETCNGRATRLIMISGGIEVATSPEPSEGGDLLFRASFTDRLETIRYACDDHLDELTDDAWEKAEAKNPNFPGLVTDNLRLSWRDWWRLRNQPVPSSVALL